MRAASRRALLLCLALFAPLLVTGQPAHAAEVARATFSGQVSIDGCWESDPVGTSYAWACRYSATATDCEEPTPTGGFVPCTVTGSGWAKGVYGNTSQCASVGRMKLTVSSSQHPDVTFAVDLLGEQSTIFMNAEPAAAAAGMLAFFSAFASPHCRPGPHWVGLYVVAY